jgi:hypothetical protein
LLPTSAQQRCCQNEAKEIHHNFKSAISHKM